MEPGPAIGGPGMDLFLQEISDDSLGPSRVELGQRSTEAGQPSIVRKVHPLRATTLVEERGWLDVSSRPPDIALEERAIASLMWATHHYERFTPACSVGPCANDLKSLQILYGQEFAWSWPVSTEICESVQSAEFGSRWPRAS